MLESEERKNFLANNIFLDLSKTVNSERKF